MPLPVCHALLYSAAFSMLSYDKDTNILLTATLEHTSPRYLSRRHLWLGCRLMAKSVKGVVLMIRQNARANASDAPICHARQRRAVMVAGRHCRFIHAADVAEFLAMPFK